MINAIAKRIVRKIRTIVSTPYRKIRVRRFLAYVSSMKKENEIIIVLSPLIGDTCYALSFISELKKKHTEETICVTCVKRQKPLLSLYPEIDRIIILDQEMGKSAELFTFDNKYSEEYLSKNIINGNAFFYKKCYEADNPDIMYQLRTHIYNVGENAKITYHEVPKVENPSFLQRFYAPNHRIAILNPYSHSTFEASVKTFIAICEYLKQNDYMVYTNVIGNQKAIKGSKELRCSIDELFYIATSSTLIVSTRSGILDYLVPSNINIFAIYDNCSSRLKKMYHLNNWECEGLIKEVYPGDNGYKYSDIIRDLNNFTKQIESRKFDGSIN